MQNDGEPYVADFTVFFLIESAPEKDQKSCFNQSINRLNFKREAFDSSTVKLMTLWLSVRQKLKVKNKRWSTLEILHSAKWSKKITLGSISLYICIQHYLEPF